MKGKKTYAFRCGCCWAHDCREEERSKADLREMAAALAAKQQPLGEPFERVLFDNLWELYAR